jgi:hypothetical protein
VDRAFEHLQRGNAMPLKRACQRGAVGRGARACVCLRSTTYGACMGRMGLVEGSGGGTVWRGCAALVAAAPARPPPPHPMAGGPPAQPIAPPPWPPRAHAELAEHAVLQPFDVENALDIDVLTVDDAVGVHTRPLGAAGCVGGVVKTWVAFLLPSPPGDPFHPRLPPPTPSTLFFLGAPPSGIDNGTCIGDVQHRRQHKGSGACLRVGVWAVGGGPTLLVRYRPWPSQWRRARARAPPLPFPCGLHLALIYFVSELVGGAAVGLV